MAGLQNSASRGGEVTHRMEEKQPNSPAISGDSEPCFNQDIDFDSRLDRCILRVQQLRKEAQRALDEPRMPVLLAQGACEAETALVTANVGGVVVKSKETGQGAVDLLRMQDVKFAQLPLLKLS